MPTTVTYPSAELPGPPRISLSLPDGWEILTVPGVQIAAAEPARDAGFRTNLVVSVQRAAAGTELSSVAADLARRTAELPAHEDLGTGELEIAGRSWLASEYGYTQAGADTVVQASRYCVLDRGSATDVVEVVGSCGADRADTQIEIIRGMQDSVRIDIP